MNYANIHKRYKLLFNHRYPDQELEATSGTLLLQRHITKERAYEIGEMLCAELIKSNPPIVFVYIHELTYGKVYNTELGEWQWEVIDDKELKPTIEFGENNVK